MARRMPNMTVNASMRTGPRVMPRTGAPMPNPMPTGAQGGTRGVSPRPVMPTNLGLGDRIPPIYRPGGASPVPPGGWPHVDYSVAPPGIGKAPLHWPATDGKGPPWPPDGLLPGAEPGYPGVFDPVPGMQPVPFQPFTNDWTQQEDYKKWLDQYGGQTIWGNRGRERTAGSLRRSGIPYGWHYNGRTGQIEPNQPRDVTM